MANCKYCIDYTCGGQGTDEENPHCGGYGQGVRYRIPRDKPKEDIDLEQRIYYLERENKTLKHQIEHNAKRDEIARKIINTYKKFASEFHYEISDAEFDEWWTKPPTPIN